MAQWHLDDLRAALIDSGWEVQAELPGDDHAISGSWKIRLPEESITTHLDFEGLDEKEVLPMERSYGCRLRNTDLSLYFSRRGVPRSRARERWTALRDTFVRQLSLQAKLHRQDAQARFTS